MIIFSPDSLRAQVEAASHGRATVLYDDQGHPSAMAVIPKFRYEDLNLGGALGSGTCTAFLKGGQEQDAIFVGLFPAKILDSRAISMPGHGPEVSVDFDAARAACTVKGTGWHLMTVHEWAAITLLALDEGLLPRGNTDWGRHHLLQHEDAPRVDGGDAGDPVGSGVTITGSGWPGWRHLDGYGAALDDLVGNVWEWLDLLKIDDGRVICTADNEFDLAEGSWTAQAAYFDSPAAGDDAGQSDLGDPTLADAVTNYAGTAGTTGNFDFNESDPWSSLATSGAYASIELLQRLLIEPAGLDPGGHLQVRNYGERMAARGGDFTSGAKAGLAALRLTHPRTYTAAGRGFRPAFIP